MIFGVIVNLAVRYRVNAFYKKNIVLVKCEIVIN